MISIVDLEKLLVCLGVAKVGAKRVQSRFYAKRIFYHPVIARRGSQCDIDVRHNERNENANRTIHVETGL